MTFKKGSAGCLCVFMQGHFVNIHSHFETRNIDKLHRDYAHKFTLPHKMVEITPCFSEALMHIYRGTPWAASRSHCSGLGVSWQSGAGGVTRESHSALTCCRFKSRSSRIGHSRDLTCTPGPPSSSPVRSWRRRTQRIYTLHPPVNSHAG